jgi:hypothetical protein
MSGSEIDLNILCSLFYVSGTSDRETNVSGTSDRETNDDNVGMLEI